MSSGMQVNGGARLALGAIAALGTIGGAASIARADATVISQVALSTGGSRTQTTYYKGHKMRVDPGGKGAIVILDGDTNKTYILNPAQKTYLLLNSSANSASAMMAMLKVNTTASVKATGAVRKIAGQLAHEYKFVADIDMSADSQMMSAMGGGAPAKGGAAAPMHIGTIHIDGDEWVTNIASLPGGGAGTAKASLRQLVTMIPGAKTILDKMAAIPGVPIAERQSSTTMMSVGPGAGKKRATETSFTATSVREGTLADSLFTIPAGYKLQAGGMMGMPTGGARRPGMPGAMPPR